jgi:hypothetical protein
LRTSLAPYALVTGWTLLTTAALLTWAALGSSRSLWAWAARLAIVTGWAWITLGTWRALAPGLALWTHWPFVPLLAG